MFNTFFFLVIAFFCIALTTLLFFAMRAQKGGWEAPLQCCSTHTPQLFLKQDQAQTSQRSHEKKLLQLLDGPRLFPGDQMDQLPSLEREELINIMSQDEHSGRAIPISCLRTLVNRQHQRNQPRAAVETFLL